MKDKPTEASRQPQYKLINDLFHITPPQRFINCFIPVLERELQRINTVDDVHKLADLAEGMAFIVWVAKLQEEPFNARRFVELMATIDNKVDEVGEYI